jgi:DNA helicase MCM8
MEQQQVSIAKAGIVASLPARCSLIAAANPRHGSYNMNKTVAENLNMAKPILSRFDLVFILRDRADTEQDRMVSNNIMNLYRSDGGHPSHHHHQSRAQGQSSGSATAAATSPSADDGSTASRMSLSERLSWVTGFQKEPLPADLVRDYIAYAREYCQPKLTSEAAVVLKEFFMGLR